MNSQPPRRLGPQVRARMHRTYRTLVLCRQSYHFLSAAGLFCGTTARHSLKQLEQIAVAIEQDHESLEVMRRLRTNADFVGPSAQLRWLRRQLPPIFKLFTSLS